MNLASIVVKELLGLFVDDGSLAIGILVCVAAVAALDGAPTPGPMAPPVPASRPASKR
jgi:hypothetical protein